jgi:hypothetical protein
MGMNLRKNKDARTTNGKITGRFRLSSSIARVSGTES